MATRSGQDGSGKKPRRARRWLVRGVLAGLLLLTLATAWVVHLTRPANLRPMLEGVLGRALGGDVVVGRAQLSLGGRLTVTTLWLDVPGLGPERGEFARVFSARRVGAELDYSGLWRGELRVREIAFDRPELNLTRDAATGRMNFEMLDLDRGGDDGGPGLRLPPTIEVNGARVNFGVGDGRGGVETRSVMRLAGELRERPQRPGTYGFELRQFDAEARRDATLTGRLDTVAQTLHLELRDFEIDAAHRMLLPMGFRDWWATMDPTGRLPRLAVNLDVDDSGRPRLRRAELELSGIAITPPYDAIGRAMADAGDPPRYNPRMTGVTGRVELDDHAVWVRGLTGLIEGVQYHADGVWPLPQTGPQLQDAVRGQITLATDPFVLEREPPFLASLPAVGRQIFRVLSPSGRFQSTTRLTQAEVDGPVEITGELKLLGARGVYRKFPLPVTEMRGVVAFDRERVVVRDLVGVGPSGGMVSIRGEISPPGDGAAVRLSVEARGIPFDEHLQAALSDTRRAAVGVFFDEAMHATLVREGALRGPDEAGASQAGGDWQPPAFTLGGAIDVDVLVDRPLGRDTEYAVTTTIQAAGVSALFRYWPYPLTGVSGQIVARPGGIIELDDVVMAGPTGGRGTLSGTLSQPDRGGPVLPDLTVTDATLPVDPLLVHAIRADARDTLADLHPGGEVTGTATITKADAALDTRWAVAAEVQRGELQPNRGAYRLVEVAGGFDVDNDGLTLRGLTGRRGDAALTIDGGFRWGRSLADEQPGDRFRLDLDGRNLRLEPALLDLLPADHPQRGRLAALFDEHRPAGQIDATLNWLSLPPPPEISAGGTDGLPETYTLRVEPTTFGMDLLGQRLEFDEMAGAATLRPGRADLDELAGSFTHGRATIDGLVGLDGVTPTAITWRARADTACPYTRKALPDAAVAVLDQLEVTGDYRLTDARLLHRPAPGPGETELELDARVELIGTSLTLGVPVTRMSGVLDTRVRRHPGEDRPRLRFNLRAAELRAADRRVAPLTVTLANTPNDPNHLRFGPMLGGVYGGVLVGHGRVPLNPADRYQIDLTLSDAEVDPLLDPATHDPTHGITIPGITTPGINAPGINAAADDDDDTWPTTLGTFTAPDRDLGVGLLSASLHLEAPIDTPELRRGRGAMRIADARLFDRPLSNALLRATNFSLPTGAPLSAASARYLVRGDRVRFDELAFEGPSLTIAGAGTMTLPDTALNLVMVSRNRAAPRLGPVSDLLNMFRDELLAIRVTGTLEQPQTGLTTLRGTRETWSDLFGPTRAATMPGAP